VEYTPPKQQLKDIFGYFGSYIKNPLYSIKNVPDWNWPTVLIVQLCVSILFGAISDIFAQDQLIILKGSIFFPLSSFITTFLGAGFFYFMIIIFFDTNVNFLKLYTIVFLSHLPFLFLRLLKYWIAPIELIGFAATTALLTVGFVENFQLPKKKLIKIFSLLYMVYFLMWVTQQIYRSKNTYEFKNEVHKQQFDKSESVDEIEKELKNY
jgi:hypothetical protein